MNNNWVFNNTYNTKKKCYIISPQSHVPTQISLHQPPPLPPPLQPPISSNSIINDDNFTLCSSGGV